MVHGGGAEDHRGRRQLGAAVNTLLVFDRARQSVPWTLSGSTVLDRPLPEIARDQAGYAIAVTTTDSSLLLRPDVVGATQAAVVDDGPASPAAAVVGGGPQTTGLYAAQAARGRDAGRGSCSTSGCCKGRPSRSSGCRPPTAGRWCSTGCT